MKKYLPLFVFSLIALPGAALAIDYGGPYTEPNCAPPACNVAAPINVGTSPQEKKGGLLINTPGTQAAFSVVGSSWFYAQPLQTVQTVVAHFLGKIRIGGGSPKENRVLVAEDPNGNATWKDLSVICQETGACGGGGGLAPGTVQGQTIYWDKLSKAWKNSVAVFITNNAAGTKQSLQVGNSVPNSADDIFYVSGSSNFQGKIKINTPTSASTDKNGDVLTLINSTTGEADWKTPAIGTGGNSGPWTLDGNNIYNSNTGPVGIGTGNNLNSSYKLQVEGAVSVSKDNFLTFGNGLAKNSSQDASINMTPLASGINTLDIQGGYLPMAPYVGRVIRLFDIVQINTAAHVDKICNRLGQNCKLVDNIGDGLPDGTDKSTLRYDGSKNKWVSNTALTNDGTNIGIGTQNPGSDLEVNRTKTGTTEIKTINGSTGQAIAQVGAYNTSASGFEDGTRIITTGPGYVNSGNNDPAFTSDTGILRSGANLRGLNISANSGDIGMFVGASKALTINRATAGNIGVGIDVPTTKVDIAADGAGISLRSRGNLLLNSGNDDGARLVWRGGPSNGLGYRARVGADGSLGFFEKEGGSTALRIYQPNDSYYNVNPGMVYAPNLKSDALTATYAVAKHLQVDTRGSAFVPAKDKILVALNDNGDATWKTPADIGINGGATYTPGTGIAISASKVISNTSLNTDNQTLALSGNTLSISGGNSVTLPTGTTGATYTAGSGINIANGVITNTAPNVNQTLTVQYNTATQGNELVLSNGGNPIPYLPVAANNQTMYFNNGWKVNPYFTIDGAGSATFLGQILTNNLATKNLQVSTGPNSSVKGQVLTADDTSGTAVWKDAPTLPTNGNDGATVRYNATGKNWLANNALVSNGLKVGVGLASGIASFTNEAVFQVYGGLKTDALYVNPNGNNTVAPGGVLTAMSSNGAAQWQEPSVSTLYCEWAKTPVGAATTGNCTAAKSPVQSTNNNYVLLCPADHPKVISGGAWCDSNRSALRESRPTGVDTWKVSCRSTDDIINTATDPDGASMLCSK